MPRKYNTISADSHLDLSPERWRAHVPAKWRDQAPRVVRLETAEDAIVIGDLWGFLSDPIGVQERDSSVGAERLMWGSDFAHAASDWPNSQRVIEQNFAGVPESDRDLITVGNAIRFFHLDGAS